MNEQTGVEDRVSSTEDELETGNDFVERLRQLASIAGSANALAKAAGISQGGLQRYLKGGEPTRKVLISLARSMSVDLGWLLTGEGEMHPSTRDVGGDDMYAYIPLYDARCSAGDGAWNERTRILVHLAFTFYGLRKKGLNPSSLVCLRVDGDSMTGLLEDGDTVMIDQSRDSLAGEGVYVVQLDGHLYAKRLQRQFDGAILIISNNPAYKEMVVPRDRVDELQIIGRVVWAGGWVI